LGWNLLNNFHSLVIYIYVGSLFSLILVLLLLSFGKIKSARLRALFLLLPLFLPVLSYFLFHVFFNKPCTAGIFQGHANMTWLSWICVAGEWLATYMTPLFILALIIGLIRVSLSTLASRRLKIKYGIAKAGAYPRVEHILMELSKKIHIPSPRLIVTDQSRFQAFTFGIIRPSIVISKGLLEGLSEKELEAVFAHEIAHIKRRDSFVNWLAAFIRDISLFNPVAIYSFSKFLSEQEQACDEIGLDLTKDPVVYGQTLIKVWKNSRQANLQAVLADHLVSHPGFLRSTGLLEKRIKKVIDFQPQKKSKRSMKWPVVVAVIFFSLLFMAIFC
jgi:beta-lactamase regulating signal transducer with metallopeptidase domain